MEPFRKLTESMFASPQISVGDIESAKEHGITLVINNRPDGEDPSAPHSPEIEAAAKAAGIEFLAIPVSHAGFSMPQVDAMAQALQNNEGKTLAYCRSGTRSTLLWALARAKMGDDPESIAQAAESAGYDVSAVRPTIDMLAAG
ncbi:TIGR01244 family sulfur transferase [Erythrobacter sp. GH1-10]|uniref:TIGR01244 family sulfur transferase n=1 Tax=Erythrobacter sp. GH1-10 TaxID=3349334 RepID=UPI003877955A